MPDTAEVLFGAGVCYMLAPKIFFGDDTKAKRYLEQSIALRPLFPNGHVRLAQLARRTDDQQQFHASLAQARTLDPNNELLIDLISKANRFVTD